MRIDTVNIYNFGGQAPIRHCQPIKPETKEVDNNGYPPDIFIKQIIDEDEDIIND